MGARSTSRPPRQLLGLGGGEGLEVADEAGELAHQEAALGGGQGGLGVTCEAPAELPGVESEPVARRVVQELEGEEPGAGTDEPPAGVAGGREAFPGELIEQQRQGVVLPVDL